MAGSDDQDTLRTFALTARRSPPLPCLFPAEWQPSSSSQNVPVKRPLSPPVFSTNDRKRRSQETPTAAEEWQRRKTEEDAFNPAIDEVMELVGLEEVKRKFLAIQSRTVTYKNQNVRFHKERFSVVFQGNPGTGKTTVARTYANLLRYTRTIRDPYIVEETSGAKLASNGPGATRHMIEKMLYSYSSVILFVDEAYQLTAPHASSSGRDVLNVLLTEMENHMDKLVVIFVGYHKEMQSFFEHNPGLSSRISYTLDFQDLDDVELWTVLRDSIQKKYNKKMQVADGFNGLYMRIAVRRLARRRGVRGFGNARSVQNLLSEISERQCKRLSAKRRKSNYSSKIHDNTAMDYFYFSKEDIIGPDPSEAIFHSQAWDKLQQLVGLDAVKKAARSVIDMIETNYLRELHEKSPLSFSLNRVFFGSPGTGKTTVAKLYGQILADAGLLSNGEVVTKNPSDFIGQHMGDSEARTRDILAATIGKVLIIDEAYMLGPSGGGSGSGNGIGIKNEDSYRNAVIDTLVAEVQSVPGDDRCILLLGYEDRLKEMFQHVNPGLSRRFAIEDAFRFEDYDLAQLQQILEFKMEEQNVTATPEALAVALDMMDRARMRPNFANGGEVENCLMKAKLNFQARQSKKPPSERDFDVVFEPEDFDPEYNRQPDCRQQLEGKVANDIIEKLEGYQQHALAAKFYGWELRNEIPTRFVFKGPSGTGKTTAARNMGKIYYDMGFLSTDEVIECSVTELIGQYIGQTGPKTKAQLEKALGKVLVIDEAYRLNEGSYASEATNEMIHCLQSLKYDGKIVVVLAGHTPGMNELMANKPGLASLFPEEIIFRNIPADDSLAILSRELEQRRISAPFLKDTSSCAYRDLHKLIKQLSQLPSWGNARDIKTLAKEMACSALRAKPITQIPRLRPHTPEAVPGLSVEQAKACVRKMIDVQHDRRSIREQQSGQIIGGTLLKFAQLRAEEACCKPVEQVRQEASKSTSPEAGADVVNKQLQAGKETATDTERKETEEQRLQKRLREIGECPEGFRYVKVTGGYVCEGGMHYVSDEQLGL